jgi:hypothetical protein
VDKTISELQGKGIITGEDAELRILLDAEEEEAKIVNKLSKNNIALLISMYVVNKSK